MFSPSMVDILMKLERAATANVDEKEAADVDVEAPMPFQGEELMRMAEMYVQHYDAYHYSGTRPKETFYGKHRILQDMAVEISSLGYGKRSERQIEQRIRDEMKRVKKFELLNTSDATNADGARSKAPRLTPSQMFLHSQIGCKFRASVGPPTTANDVAPGIDKPQLGHLTSAATNGSTSSTPMSEKDEMRELRLDAIKADRLANVHIKEAEEAKKRAYDAMRHAEDARAAYYVAKRKRLESSSSPSLSS